LDGQVADYTLAAEVTLENIALPVEGDGEGEGEGEGGERSNDKADALRFPNRLRESILSRRDKTELSVTVPERVTFEKQSMLLRIEYEVNHGAGMHFVLYSPPPSSNKKFYFQVHAAGVAGMGRLWIPCFEGESIPWDIEYHIHTEGLSPIQINAISVASSGALCQQFVSAEVKTFQFKLDLLTPPSAISFATGLFDMVRIPAAPFAAAFCPAGMGAKLSLAVEFLSRAFGFINWYLGGGQLFPYPSYYVCFLRDALAIDETGSGANVSLFSSHVLFDISIIEQGLATRLMLCESLARQYFGERVRPMPGSRWLTMGLAGFLAMHMLRIFHGNNDFRYNVRRDMETVLLGESGHGPVTAVPDIFSNPADEEWLRLKSYLIVVLLDNRLEKGSLQKILTQLWAECTTTEPGGRHSDSLSTGAFLKTAKRVSGKDMRSFAEQWIFSAGCPVFSCTFAFNRKRSTIEVDLKQSTPGHSHKKVAGSLLIRVHEVDGVFDHSVHIDDYSHHYELPVHAKAKKIKKKKKIIPLLSPDTLEARVEAKDEGEEAEEESFVSPLSWIRLDAEMEWIASLELHQPDYMLIEQLQNDRDVVAQHEAIVALRRQPSDAVVESLERILNDAKCFHRIRAEAAAGLAACAPQPESHLGGLKLISFYNKGFALQSTETVVVPVPKTHNFESLQSYFILRALPGAMGEIRTRNGTLMELVGQILLNMLRFNDNAGNVYSDNYHIAGIIAALVAHLVARKELGLPTERLTREFVRELDRYAIAEKIQPYYHNTVMVAVLDAWRELQKMGFAHSTAITSPEILVKEGNFIKVRLAALEYLFAVSDNFGVIVESFMSMMNGTRATKAATIEFLAGRLSPKNVACRADLINYKAVLWTALSRCVDDVLMAVHYLHFIGRHVPDVSVSDLAGTSTGPGRISLRISRPATQHELSSGDEAAVPAGGEPDWLLLEVGGGEVGSQPTPKLKVPTHTPTTLVQRLQAATQSIWNNYDSFPFRYPVDRSVVGYYDIIKNPMDLSTIQARLSSMKNGIELCEALRLMFDNCFHFNQPDSLIYEQARRLRSFAFRELKRLFPEVARDVRGVLMTKEPILAVQPVPEAVTLHVTERQPKKARVETLKKEEILTNLQKMERIMEKVGTHPYAFWFREPVDPVALNIPSYPDIIREPMDLGTLTEQLDELENNPAEFIRLLDLVFFNCITFNPSNTVVHQNALQMRKEAQRLVKRYFGDAIVRGGGGGADKPNSAYRPSLKLSIPTAAATLSARSPQKLTLKITLPTKDTTWYSQAYDILNQTCAHEYAAPFLQPVDPTALGIPSYLRIIKNPMDLSTIRSKLDSSAYSKPSEMHRDVKLMFANCYRFNGKTAPISECAKVLESFYGSLYLKLCGGHEEN
jgi:hypothetical protein